MQPFVLIRRLIPAVGAWAVLAAFGAGVPTLLVKLAGSPVSGLSPTHLHVATALRRPLSDHAIMRLLAGGAWVLWTYLAVVVVVEAVRVGAGLKGRRRSRLAPAGLQRLVGRLVAAAFLMGGPVASSVLGSVTASAAPLPVASPVLRSASVVSPHGAGLALTRSRPSTGAFNSAAVYGPEAVAPAGGESDPVQTVSSLQHSQPGALYVVVRPGDTLWGLAATHLGAGERASDIWTLNQGRLMTTGQYFSRPGLIRPGWVLVMPADATGTQVAADRPQAPASDASAPQSGSAQPAAAPGHPLASVAAPPSAASSTAAAVGSPTTVAPAAAVVPPTTVAPAAAVVPPTTAAPAAAVVPPTTVVAPPTPATGPGREAVGVPGGSPTSVSPAITPPDAQAQTLHPGARVTDGHQAEAALAGVGGLVAAGVIWKLGRRRTEQMHQRRRGRSIPRNSAAVEEAERAARAIATPEAMRWIDLGLRYLTRLVADAEQDYRPQPQHGEPAITVVLVRAGAHGLEIMIDPPQPKPLGRFSAVDEGAVWVLDPDIDLDQLEALAQSHWTAWPALVTLGDTPDGPLLANLEHAGCLAVQGDPERVDAFMVQVALELISQPWADEAVAGVYALSGPVEVAALPGVGTADGAQAEMDLAERLDGLAEATRRYHGDARLGPARAQAGESQPHVALAFAGADPSAVRCLQETAVADRSAVAVVAGDVRDAARWAFTVQTSGEAVLEGRAGERPIHLAVTVASEEQVINRLAEAMVSAADTAGVAPIVDLHPEPHPEAVDDRAEVEIGLLGRLQVSGGAGVEAVEASRRAAVLALLAYLLTHSQPVTADQIAAALWPVDESKENFGSPQRKTVMNIISRARAVLGSSAQGERLYHRTDGYRLQPEVTSDWHRFQSMVRTARERSGVASLTQYRAALELVRGEPFAGSLASPFFEWVSSEHLDLTMLSVIVDAADEMGHLALDLGDWDAAAWAAQRGLDIDPAREELFQVWMHACGRAGQADRVAEIYRRLCRSLQRVIHPMQEPTSTSQAILQTYLQPGEAAWEG
jgi:DNA-binding SARP family transcriptional activator/LysM repeat protein